jgi:hypothetical protein
MAYYVVQEALFPPHDCKATCLCILHDVLHLEKFNLRWVAHSLNSNQNTERVTRWHGLLEVLEKDEEDDFRNILTRDESRFYLKYSHESAWAASRDEVLEKIKQKLTPKSV